jgi:hypothetical protein
MDTTPLCVFVTKVTRNHRIVFGDLRRLQRDVLPTGATSREEVEALLSLDSLGQLDDDWPDYLVATVKAFVLSTSNPPGSVDANTAAWLTTALSDARPRSATAIVRAILRDAKHVDDALLVFGRRAKRPALADGRGVDPQEKESPGCGHPGPAGLGTRLEVEGLGG